MLNLGESAPKGATQVQRACEPVQSAPFHPSELQDVVEQCMLGGELFGTACLVARRDCGLADGHLVTRADLEGRR